VEKVAELARRDGCLVDKLLPGFYLAGSGRFFIFARPGKNFCGDAGMSQDSSPIDQIISALVSALEAVIGGLTEAILAFERAYKKIGTLIYVIFLTLLFMFPLLSAIYIGIAQRIWWLSGVAGVLAFIYIWLIVRGFTRAAGGDPDVGDTVALRRAVPRKFVLAFTIMDAAIAVYIFYTYFNGAQLVRDTVWHIKWTLQNNFH
jgi:hypothetical protein